MMYNATLASEAPKIKASSELPYKADDWSQDNRGVLIKCTFPAKIIALG